MSRSRFSICSGWLSVGLTALLLIAQNASAKPRIGVAVEAMARDDVDAGVLSALTQSMQTTVGESPMLRVVPRDEADVVLYASIAALSDQRKHNEREVDCRVSVIVTEASGGAIRMTLSGRAVARGMSRSDGLTRAAMGAAVRSALSPLAQSLRVSR